MNLLKSFAVWMLFALSIICNSNAHAAIWIETFNSGVGRLDQTRGNGDIAYTYDSENQRINGTFVNGGVKVRRRAVL